MEKVAKKLLKVHFLTNGNFFIIEPLEYEDFEEEEDVVDLRANDIVGGVFHFNLMSLPPQPKTMNKWIVTRCKGHKF